MNWLSKISDLNSKHKRTLALCWLTYMLAYLLRTNLAVLIPTFISIHQMNYTQMGLITSMFFISYMFGQIISGLLGDKYNAKILIIFGLSVSSLCNFAMALGLSYLAILHIWALNGLAQSLLWAPLMKILSNWFAVSQLGSISFRMSFSIIIGSSLSWILSTLMIAFRLWQLAFWIPAIFVSLFIFVIIYCLKAKPEFENKSIKQTIKFHDASNEIQFINKEKSKKISANSEKLKVLNISRIVGLPGLMLIAVTQGMTREGINVWIPSIILSENRFTSFKQWLIFIVMPLLNIFGILIVKKIYYQVHGNELKTLIVVNILIIIILVILNMFSGNFYSIILIVIILCLSNGLTPVLTSAIPFQFSQFKCVSFIAGIINFAIYIGAATSTMLSGLIVSKFEMSYLYKLWLVSSLFGLIFTSYRFVKTRRDI